MANLWVRSSEIFLKTNVQIVNNKLQKVSFKLSTS